MQKKYNLFLLMSLFIGISNVVGNVPLKYYSQNISSRYGLSSDLVNEIIQDDDGFLWLATDDGLNRYDGYEFKVFKIDYTSENTFNSNIFKTLCDDGNGNIWIGTAESGINVFNKNTGKVTIYTSQENSEIKLKSNIIQKLFRDSYGNIWIGTDAGIMRYSPETGNIEYFNAKKYSSNSAINASILSISEDSKQNIWFGTIWRGMLMFNLKNESFKNFDLPKKQKVGPSNWGRGFFEDSRKNSWIGTWGEGFYKADFKKNNEIKFKPYNNNQPEKFYVDGLIYSSFNEDVFGNIWAGGPEGLDILIRESDFSAWHNPVSQNGDNTLSNITITSILKDKSGILWISTLGKGIYKIDPYAVSFSKHTLNENDLLIKSQSIYAVAPYGNNQLLLGVKSNGFGVYDIESSKFTNYKQLPIGKFLPSDLNTVRAVVSDQKGRYWMGTRYNGLFLVDFKNNFVTSFSLGNNVTIPVRLVNHLLIDKNNHLWIATRIGLFKLVETGDNVFEVYSYNSSNGLSSNVIETLFIDNEGVLWVGTGKGISKLTSPLSNHKNALFESIITDNSVFNKLKIASVFEDNNQQFWVGSEGAGLFLLERSTKKVIPFNKDEGLPGDAVYSITQDTEGNLWLSTNAGLILFKPTSPSKERFSVYTEDDGLQGNIFIKGSFARLPDGQLFFGGHNGFNMFDPALVHHNSFVPAVMISDLKVFNKSINFDFSKKKELILKHSDKSFTIEFTALSFSHPFKNQYAFKLEGFDSDWNLTNASNRRAHYSNLKHGKYTFLVKASNSGGLWNQLPYSFTIKVLPSPWLSVYAYILYFVLILTGFFVVYKFLIYRTKLLHAVDIEKMERERTENLNQFKFRFFTNISHELLTPLSIISCTVDNLSKKLINGDNDVVSIQNNVNRLVRLIRQLLDFRKIEAGDMKLLVGCGNLSIFLGEIIDNFLPLANKNKIDLIFHAEEINDVWFDGDKMDKILHNLLSNALKYSAEGGEVFVHCHAVVIDNVKHARITVKDNGKGISPDKLERIFDRFYRENEMESTGSGIGLSLTKNLVELHNGEISVVSQKGVGTEFTIVLPIDKKAYLESQLLSTAPEHHFSLHSEIVVTNSSSDAVFFDRQGNRYSVLLVEDNKEFRIALTDSLSRSFNVLSASNGSEAFELAVKSVPDIIVSDVMMPGMDGFELCRKVKSTLEVSHIPVVLLTAKTNSESRETGYESGADSYLAKPVNVSLLETRIRGLIELREKLKKRFQTTIDLEPEKVNLTSLDEKFILKAKEIVEKNIDDETLNVHRLVKEMSTSNSMLYRKITGLTGLSPNEFIKNIRLKRAAQLLSENKFNISEVAFAVGFHDQSYFSVCFKKHFGKTPSEFVSTDAVDEKN
jgi:signal transduction histidine kinase/ligand-binding sensor domain-containing protein/DNA-binding response OmpR family regulator